MKNILRVSSVALFVIVLAGCGSSSKETKSEVTEKKMQLEKLKKDKSGIETEIKKLEEEIASLDPSSKDDRAKLVTVAPVLQQDFTHYIELQGRVDANDVVIVTPRGGPAQVKQIYVKRGDLVKKGQLLLKLDDAIMLQQLDGLKTQLDYAKDIYSRQKNLWDQGIGTEVQLITSKNAVTVLEKQIATLKENWKTSFVYAPISGLADEVNIESGEIFTGMGATGPQIRLVNSSNMKIVTEVPENYISRVKKGTQVLIVLPDNNKIYNSVITVMGASINPNTRGFITEARVPSEAGLKLNQVALVRIRDYNAPNAITIPVNIIQSDESGKYVFVMVKEGNAYKARKKKVEVGESYNGIIEIKAGLTTTDQIITEGYQSVYEGQVITVNRES